MALKNVIVMVEILIFSKMYIIHEVRLKGFKFVRSQNIK